MSLRAYFLTEVFLQDASSGGTSDSIYSFEVKAAISGKKTAEQLTSR